MLGKTGVVVTALGFGAAPIGNLYEAVPDEQAAQTVTAAWDAGIRYFDTAPHYGMGLSERRVEVGGDDRVHPSRTRPPCRGRAWCAGRPAA